VIMPFMTAVHDSKGNLASPQFRNINMTSIFFVQCIIKLRLPLITLTWTLIILDIAKAHSIIVYNDLAKTHLKRRYLHHGRV